MRTALSKRCSSMMAPFKSYVLPKDSLFIINIKNYLNWRQIFFTMFLSMEINEWIKFSRKRAGITQDQLAENLEVTRGNVSIWENGRHEPNISQIKEDCHTFLNWTYNLFWRFRKKGRKLAIFSRLCYILSDAVQRTSANKWLCWLQRREMVFLFAWKKQKIFMSFLKMQKFINYLQEINKIRYIKGFDWLRASAVVNVMFYHLS